jgi:hypothetical protein
MSAVGSLSCARYSPFGRTAGRSGTCEGACEHYVECKDDPPPDAYRQCLAECRDIYVHDGDADVDSLLVFEGLECKATIAFVEGTDEGRHRSATSGRPAKVRSQAR